VSTELKDWAPRIAIRLRRVPKAVEGKLRALVFIAGQDARRNVHVISGDLKRSIYATLDRKQIRIGATAPYARIEEEGGTILPTKGRYLAIPLQKGLPKAGPRADGKLFCFKSKDGRLFLARRDEKAIDVRWKLQASVTRKAHPYLKPAIEKLRKAIPAELGSAVAIALLRGGG
jgi:hypothetical protein